MNAFLSISKNILAKFSLRKVKNIRRFLINYNNNEKKIQIGEKNSSEEYYQLFKCSNICEGFIYVYLNKMQKWQTHKQIYIQTNYTWKNDYKLEKGLSNH